MEETKGERDLIVMIGMSLSGKTYHVDNNYQGYQLVSFKHYQAALQVSKLQNPEIIYPAMELAVRANMIKGLPIVIDENNSNIDSLFIWKSISREHGYNTRGVFIDTPLDVCVARLKYMLEGKKITEEMHEKLNNECEKIEELKQILKMKHQSVVDSVIFITYDGG